MSDRKKKPRALPGQSRPSRAIKAAAVFAALCVRFGLAAAPDAPTIIQRSVAANQADWQAAPGYDYTEQEHVGPHIKTYQVRMIFGTPYERLTAVDGKPLSQDEQAKEQKKMDDAIAQRRAESPDDRAKRLAAFEKSRNRDHILMEQLTKAFNFTLVGQSKIGSRPVYMLRATPRPGYTPPNLESQVLPGMRGELWIDQKTFQWVKVTATVIRPVSIEGFLARVEPGTYFELEKIPVAEGIWLPKHFEMKSHSKILSMVSHRTAEDISFSDYHKSTDTESTHVQSALK